MIRALAVLLPLLGLAILPTRGVADDASTRGVAAGPAPRTVAIKVTDAGFEPKQVRAKVGEPVTLAFTRTSDRTCMTAIDIPDEDVKELELPLNRTVTVTVTPRKRGVERFHCSAMGMGGGKIVVQ